MDHGINNRKAAIIGCGFVGAASGFALMESGLFSEMVLLDANKDKAEGEAYDIAHGIPFGRPMKIYAGDYDDIADAAIIIVFYFRNYSYRVSNKMINFAMANLQ